MANKKLWTTHSVRYPNCKYPFGYYVGIKGNHILYLFVTSNLPSLFSATFIRFPEPIRNVELNFCYVKLTIQ